MRSTLNNACICALLCGVALFAIPAFAAGAGDTAGGGIGAGTNAGGMFTNGDMNTATTDNKAAHVNITAQTPAYHMSKKAQATANAAEVEITGQLNQQQAANGAAGATVQ